MPTPQGSEQDNFLQEFSPDQQQGSVLDILDAPLNQDTQNTPPENEENQGGDNKKPNRQQRRLMERLKAERESSIELAKKVEALTESQRLSLAQNPELNETLAKIYGTNTPEGAEATALLIKALQENRELAKKEALDEFRKEQAKAAEQQAQADEELEVMIDEIEEKYNVSVDQKTEQAFFTLLERLSPKDKDGNITSYADHNAVWEQLQSVKQQTTNRAKDLASRSMVRTGASPDTSVQADANERFLRENGII